MEKFKEQFSDYENKIIHLTPEQEAINYLLDEREKIKEAIRYLATHTVSQTWTDGKNGGIYNLFESINNILEATNETK